MERFDVFTPSQSTSSVETPMANPGEYDFTNVWAPPTPGALERGLETPDRRRRRRRRRRRVDPVEEQAQEESEARRRNEENEEAAASSSAPAPRSERDLLIQMVQQMHQQSMAQNQLILDLQTRLDRMERDRQQAVPVVPVVAPPPPPTGESFACRGLDKSWIPGVPTPGWEKWRSRVDEITGFWSWCESLTSWLSLLAPQYQGEIREALLRTTRIPDAHLQNEQVARGQRLFHLLKQSFTGFKRVEHIMKLFEETSSGNGYELLRQIS